MKLDKEPLKESDPSTTALGDWYATVIYKGRQPLILAVSDRSLLSLLMPARELDQLPGHLTRTLIEKLQRMGVPETTIRQEVSKMDPVVYAKTANRSVLGSMNDFTDMVKFTHHIRTDWDLLDWMDYLDNVPCKPIGYKYPSEIAKALLKEHSLQLLN